MNKPVFYKTLFYVVMLLFTAHTQATAQENLVPNGSFEQYDSCPNGAAQITRATHWYDGNQGSADYYNSCAPLSSGVSAPNSAYGFQYAYAGNAYAGIVITSDTSTNFREYLKIKLKQPIEKNCQYHISLYAVIGVPNFGFGGIYRIGFLFTNDSLPANSITIYSSDAVYSYQTLTDTVNWVKYSATYLAKGNYNYLTIGDFSKNDNSSIVPIGPIHCSQAYIYIDSVSVTEQPIFIPNVFTPNNDGINDIFQIQGFSANTQISIYNRWGNLVFKSNQAEKEFWNGTYQGRNVSDGVYYYIISNQYYHKTGFIQLLR